MKPSSTNGQRMNQLVAPTSRMISTSRRRAKMERRTVVLISSTAAAAKMAVVTHMPFSMRLMVPSILRTVSRAYFTPLCVPGSLSTVGSSKNCFAILSTSLASLAWISNEAGSGLTGRLATMRSPNFSRKRASASSLEM